MAFCNQFEIDQMQLKMDFCNQFEIDQMQLMNAQINRSLMNSYNMLNTAMTPPMFANYTVNYADNMPVETMTWQHESKPKIDIFEAMNLLIFPYDPIRDYTKRKVERINERFRKVESLLGL